MSDSNTDVVRISLSETPNLDQKIRTLCDEEADQGRRLAATFEVQNQLILIFQGSGAQA